MNGFEIAGVVTGILGVWLTTRQSIWCWPVGLVAVLAYVVVFYEARLYAAMGLQVVFVVLIIYGWYEWLHGGAGRGALRVSRVSRRALMPLALLGLASSALLGFGLGRLTDEPLPFIDAFAMSFSLIAQWMQARKHLETWLMWVVLDLIYVGMGLSQGLWLTAGLYVVYVGLAIIGYRDWRGELTPAPEPA